MAVKQLSRFLVLAAVTIAVITSPVFPANTDKKAAKRAQLRSKLQALSRQITHVRGQLRETKKKQRRITEQLHQVEYNLQRNQNRIEQVRLKIEMTRRQVAAVAKRLKETEEKLAMHNKMLAKRLRSAYRHGPVSYASVLLSSRSFSDYVDRKYYITRVVNGDVNLISEIKRETQAVREYKATLEKKQRDLVAYENQLAVQNRVIAQQIDEKQDLLDQVENDRAKYEQALDELEQNSQEIENMIQALQETPQGRARSLKPFSGGLIMPVNGRRTSGFGYRVHPILRVSRMHTGVDISAPSGTSIRAAASGVVIHAGWWGGYGNAIIIDHGGDVSTLYAHCSSVGVRNGQSVKQGQVIGRVGSTGLSTGPHLHFEKRIKGRPVNPF